MVINCVIKFDQNQYGLYFAGQMLSGKTEITLDKPKKVKGICLKISGFAQCSWTETKTQGAGKHRRTYTVTYKGREDYLATRTYFVGSDEGNALELPAGLHTYSFSCALPPMIPTSFEGTNGHIRYTVRVILERPWKFDQSYKVGFTVLKPYDLNFESPILRIPCQMEMTKHFCCGPCRSGPFSLVASIPQSGYVPGQSITVYANITNHSRMHVDEIRYYLRRTVRYHSQTPAMKTKEEVINIQQQRTDGVPKNDDARFKVQLLIPAVPPTNTSLCKVVHITYDVKIEARAPSMHANPFVIIPITIGTVPLNQNQNGNFIPAVQPPISTVGNRILTLPITSQPQVYLNPSAPQISPNDGGGVAHNSNQQFGIVNEGFDTVDNRNAAQSPYPDMPPPSYEESVLFGNRPIEDEDDQNPIGQQLFTPRYPVYHFNDDVHGEMTNGNENENEIETNENTTRTSEASTIDANLHSEKLRDKMENWN